MIMGKKEKTFPLKSRTRQDCSFSPFTVNIVLEILAKIVRQEKEIKRI
jgi:hypothetical protein